MSADVQLKEAKRIFDEAVEMPASERQTFVEGICASNPTLRQHVEAMLREFEGGSDAFEAPLINRAAESAGSPNPFVGTPQFAIQRRLGAGAFGTVYQAWDREQQVRVALKVLHSGQPETLFRFKREFRALVDVTHPNLIRLYELFSDHERWFFSMELVEGENFLDYVRPGGGPCEFHRLRSALSQLAGAVQALHAAKLLHRDLKPANAIITNDGRVVALDFGLVRELDSRSQHSLAQVVGTPAYMSPEQALQTGVSEASDWYAVGVMLFQSLTGRLPHAGSIVDLLSQGHLESFMEPRQVEPNTPEDLNALCVAMLQRRPEDRPDGTSILTALTGTSFPEFTQHFSDHREETECFVGRAPFLRQLESAFSETQEGRFCVVLLHGRSGIGKTTLVRRLLTLLSKRQPNLLVLKGRCYEFESVPYKGLDALVDEISRLLRDLPAARVDALLPRDAFLLPRLFPVLGLISAIANSPVRSINSSDVQELRQRTFSALRELLARLSDRQPVVVWIDDLQWGDRDSSTFLAELCMPPHQPPLLLLLTFRSEELDANATLKYLHTVLADQRVVGNWRQIVVNELSDIESRELLAELLRGRDTNEATLSEIRAEAGGHPLFLQQLAHFAASGAAGVTADTTLQVELKLRTVLLRRVSELSPFARELLEFICIGAQPLPQALLFAAVGASEQAAERSEALSLLIREKFARTSGVSDQRRLEPFHDQVRSAVATSLTPEAYRNRHARLAAALSLQPDIEPQMLVTHYQQAGDLAAAYDAALKAAHIAERQLAFERAAVFYQAALETANVEPSGKRELYRKLADTLGMAGRGRESAYSYLKASECDGGSAAFDLQRLAADQLMRSGNVDEALDLFERLTQIAGIRMPHTSGEALRGIVLARIGTRLRLIAGLTLGKTTLTVSPIDMAKLELLRTAGITLTTADPMLAAYFQTKHILEALRVRHPVHLAIALAVESSVRVADGKGSFASAAGLLARAEDFAKTSGDANALGLVYLARAYVDYLLCRVTEGIAHSREAINFLKEHCTGVAWELTSAYVLLFWFSCWSGFVKDIREHLPRLLKEGAARGDVNMEVSLRLLSHAHFWYLSLDQPHECIQDFQTAIERWSRRGYHLQHYGALFAFTESCFYLGDYSRARQYVIADWEIMSGSFILRWQTLVIRALFLRGRSALACWLEEPRDNALRREVEHYAKRLKGIRSPWTLPMYHVLVAGLAVGGRNHIGAAQELEAAAEGFEKAALHAFASAARYFGGHLRNDEHGRALVASATLFLESQEVNNPVAFLRMLLPGRWLADG